MKLRLAPHCLKQDCDLDKGSFAGYLQFMSIFFLNPPRFCVLFHGRFAGQTWLGVQQIVQRGGIYLTETA